MSVISFIREAGERLFQHPRAASPVQTRTAPPAFGGQVKKPDLATLNRTASAAILAHVTAQGMATENLSVSYDGVSSTVTVTGTVPDQATREKIVVACGNVANVENVNDKLVVTGAGGTPTYYTVKRGDTLSKIAAQVYGAADKYPTLFEANRPMLSDPDKIYPGQVLRIPELAD